MNGGTPARLRDGHVGGIAFDLHVSEELVIVYQSLLLRTDASTYVAPHLPRSPRSSRLTCVA